MKDEYAEALNIVDVRKPTEYQSEHIEDATNVALDYINENMGDLQRDTTYHIHCAGGYRSVIMASILKARGFDKLVNIPGGFKALAQTDLKKTDYVCPSTL